jgi:hypothetical protein
MTFMGIRVPAGTSIPLWAKASKKAEAIAVGEAMLRRVELAPDLVDHLPGPLLELLPRDRRGFANEVVFSIGLSLRVLLVDGHDLHVLREEVGAFAAEPIDRIGEAKAAMLNEGGALADVTSLLQVFGHQLHAGEATRMDGHKPPN